jgi:putative glycosyltransferase (TIGR04372 family)
MLSRFLSRCFNIILLLPHPFAAGNASEELYFGLLAARRSGKRLVVLTAFDLPGPLRLPLLDFALLDVESPYLKFRISDKRLYPVRAVWTLWCGLFRLMSEWRQRLGLDALPNRLILPSRPQKLLYMPHERVSTLDWDIVKAMDWPSQFAVPLAISIPKETASVGEKMLRDMGIESGDWFACLHVRESSTWNDHDSVRDWNILSYIKLIQSVTSRGGWVIRMGDASMTPLPQMDGVIDYALSPWKTPSMDLFLLSSCRVYIGTQSGILETASLFDVPRLITNVVEPMWALSYKPRDFSAHMSMVDRLTNEPLNPMQLISRNFRAEARLLAIDDIDLLAQPEAQLKRVADEFLDWVDSGCPDIPRDGRSIDFQIEMKKAMTVWSLPGATEVELLCESYRWAARVYAVSPERVYDTWSTGNS